MTTLTINGLQHTLSAPTNLAALLKRLKVSDRGVAIMLNGKLVPKGAHPTTRVSDGDRMEIVRAVAGG